MKTIICCDNSILATYVIGTCMLFGFLLMVIPWASALHFSLKMIVYIFLGPWMKIVDILYQRRHSERMKRLMKEMKEREKKVWEQARLKKEEVMKLKAARILRFGRFAVKVPILNFPRYRDYPLPESIARPIKLKDSTKRYEVSPKRFIPGQKHVGVMIPGLEFGRQWKKSESQTKNEFSSSDMIQNASCCMLDCFPYDNAIHMDNELDQKEWIGKEQSWGSSSYQHLECVNDVGFPTALQQRRDDSSSENNSYLLRCPRDDELAVIDSLVSKVTD